MSEKRKRDEGSSKTEDIIQAALREQQEAKKAKKQVDPGAKEATDKGKTLGDIEQEEGGTIKESEVAMAHAKRTQKRKARKGVREGMSLMLQWSVPCSFTSAGPTSSQKPTVCE